MKQKKKSIDIARFAASLAVIAIHCPPFENWTMGDLLTDIVSRIAVPLFFTISGFLFFGKIKFVDGRVEKCPENAARLRTYLAHIGCMYGVWSLLYVLYHLPDWYRSGWWGWPLLKDCVISFFGSGIHYHLWYMPALMIAVALLYILLCWLKAGQLLFVCIPLWLIQYASCLFPQWPVFSYPVVHGIMCHLSIWWSALFCAVPLLYTGILGLRHGKPGGSHILPMLGVAAVHVAEVLVLRRQDPEANTAFVLTTPALAFFILVCLQTSHATSTRVSATLRKASEYIYFIHPMVIGLLPGTLESNTPEKYILVLSISVALSIGYVSIHSKFILPKRGKTL